MNRAEIEKQVKEILDNFAKALEYVEKEKEQPIENAHDESTRVEKEGLDSAEDFKKLFLKNAPKKNNDYIIAEKGDWI
ncbi:MAG: hypothetical protein AABX16_05040 [Nanoarchaeota archaeon]